MNRAAIAPFNRRKNHPGVTDGSLIVAAPLWRGALLSLLLLLTACVTTTPADHSKANILLEKGKAYQEKGNARMALPALRDALKHDAHNAEIHFQLGMTYDQLKITALAFEHLEKAYDLDSDNGHIANNLGVAMLRRGNLVKAEKLFQEALDDSNFKRPEDAWYNLALLYQRGIASLEGAESLNVLKGPRDYTALRQQALEMVVRLSPSHAQAHLQLAGLYHNQARYVDEQGELRALLEMGVRGEDRWVLLSRLADSYNRAGDRENARKIWHDLAREAPRSQQGRRALNNLSRW